VRAAVDVIPATGPQLSTTAAAAAPKISASVESEPSNTVCVTPRDVFPPPAPANLTAVAGTGAINLIWDAVDAADLAGYLVLRANAPGEKLTPLFDTPITDTTYKDATTTAGTRYVYAVVAVDKAAPANRSAESNRVEETGRND
jgi:fibronectin type 3 domain-containing protein